MESRFELFPDLEHYANERLAEHIPDERKERLKAMIAYGQEKFNKNEPLRLHFICTHNSRRSQLAQVWAQLAASCFGVSAQCFSGGTEVTAFNKTAVAVLEMAGFQISGSGNQNPRLAVRFSPEGEELLAYSKLFDAAENPKEAFAAVMTCSQADVNCPFIPGAEARFALNYADPKEFDGTAKELAMYEERSRQIAREMLYVFKNING